MTEEEHNIHQLRHHPVKNHEYCDCCLGKEGIILYCDGCECSYHIQCTNPPMTKDQIPESEWYCPSCAYKVC